MNFDGTAYAAESDADDEYERSANESSPVAATDSEASPVESEPPTSTEHTPTSYGYRTSADRLPETIISDWSADECADFIATIGLHQYADSFLENEIVGEALIALQHEDLKQMGIASVGHRLTILKSVYDVKRAQDIPIDSDHYVPLTADAEAQYANATMNDIMNLVTQLRLRDERMNMIENDFRRLSDDFRRLREDMLPALRLAKDAQQPLPHLSGGGQAGYAYDAAAAASPAPTPSTGGQPGGGLKRQQSTKKIMLGLAPKTASPTHMTHDRPAVAAEQTLDPTSAAERAVLSSSHLAAMNGAGQPAAVSPSYQSPNMPSPTSPAATATTLASRSYRGADQLTPSSRSTFGDNERVYAPPSLLLPGGRDGAGSNGAQAGSSSSSAGNAAVSAAAAAAVPVNSSIATAGSNGAGNQPQPGSGSTPSATTAAAAAAGKPPPGSVAPRRMQTPAPDTPSSSGSSVEIFKSFRVSMDDPCYKVLPAALRKYQINAPWDQYALYIVYGDQERCLGLAEKPLILFKQLDKEGKKPMFMLRKTNNAQDAAGDVPGSAGLGSAARGGYDPPGGII